MKGWDTRGRGRNAKVVPPAPKSPPTQAELSKLRQMHDKLGREIDKIHETMDKHPEEVKSLTGKMVHFLKSVGEWHHGMKSVVDLVAEVGIAAYALKGAVASAMVSPALPGIMHHAYALASQLLGSGVVHMAADKRYGKTRST